MLSGQHDGDEYKQSNFSNLIYKNYKKIGGARGVMVIVTGYGHGDTSSNPGRD